MSLHSTMFLFKLDFWTEWQKERETLHSTMFLFKSERDKRNLME